MSRKRSLAEHLQELAAVEPTTEPGEDAEAFAEDAALEAEDHELLSLQHSTRHRDQSLPLRSPIQLDSGEYAGKKTSRKRAFGSGVRSSSSSEDSQLSLDEDLQQEDDFDSEQENSSATDLEGGKVPGGIGSLDQYARLEAADTAALQADLKRRRRKEAVRGKAVAHQQTLWERVLEVRILLQRALVASHRLPAAVGRSAALQDQAVHLGISDVTLHLSQILQELLAVHGAVLQQNPSISEAAAQRNAAHAAEKLPVGPDAQLAAHWRQLTEAYEAFSGFRDSSLDQWHRQVMLSSGTAAMRANLKSLGQCIASQVQQSMAAPDRLIARTQLEAEHAPRRLCDPDAVSPSSELSERLPDSFDDAEFYQQLLKEFLDAAGGSAALPLPTMPKVSKKRRQVDRRASKGRRLRYDVQDRLVNFMAPVNVAAPPIAFQLFHNLFGSARTLLQPVMQ